MRGKHKSPAKRAAESKERMKIKRTRLWGSEIPEVPDELPPSQQLVPLGRQCVVRGTHHQGHPQFYAAAAGKQCTCASLMFMLNFLLQPDVSHWTPQDMDNILCHASGLYLDIVQNESYLLISELPSQVHYKDTQFRVTISPAINGSMNRTESEDPFFCIHDAAEQVLSNHHLAFITIGTNTMVLARRNDVYYMFDSHSRSSTGLCIPMGTSVLLKFTSLQALSTNLKILARTLGCPNSPFECTPVDIDVANTALRPESLLIEEVNVQDVKQKSISSLFRYSRNLQAYFKHQRQNQNSSSIQHDKEKNEKSENKRKQLYRERLTKEQREQAKSKDCERKRQCRQKTDSVLSESEKTQKKASEKERKKCSRQKTDSVLTESEKTQKKASEKERIKNIRQKTDCVLTESERTQKKASEKERKKCNRQKTDTVLTESEKTQKKASEKERVKNIRQKTDSVLTESERTQKKTSEKERKKCNRQKTDSVLTESEKTQKKASEKERVKNIRQKTDSVLTESERTQKKASEKERKKCNRQKTDSVLTESEKTQKKASEKERKKHSRQKVDNTLSSNDNDVANGDTPPYLTAKVVRSLIDFEKAIKSGPVYPCACCHRAMYRRSVVHCRKDKYVKCTKTILEQCTSDNQSDNEGNQWLCKACHSSLLDGRMPAQAQANGLQLCNIPPELKNLSLLESHLISKILPFMKIVAKPRGAQHGIKGSVVLVPANLDKIMTTLPRAVPQSGIITLALKRRMTDTHAVHLQCIDPQSVNTALRFLLGNNPFYQDVTINPLWEEQSKDANPEIWEAVTSSVNCDQQNEDDNVKCDDESDITDSEDEVEAANPSDFKEQLKQKRSINTTTCMNPTFGPEIASHHIVNIAPGEGSHPISVSKEPNWEAMTFPVLFPDGKNTYNNPSAPRSVPLSSKKYLNSRLLSIDGRFGESTQYLFQALHWQETLSLKSNMTITHRKKANETITASQLKDSSRIHRLLSDDQIFHSFKNIRGTPQYWHAMQLDMLAKVRQFGPYTFFITGSSAEFQWTEVIQVVGQQYGQVFSDEEVRAMTWETKRSWLERNPVTAARHIDYIFEQLWGKIILGGAHPVGQILTYDRRMEMQGRGTAHWHSAVMVKDAPRLDINSDEEVVQFIDQYIYCCIPHADVDLPLHELVKSRQVHHHTRSCKKNEKKSCRFGYPKPPTSRTIICRQEATSDTSVISQISKRVLSQVMTILQSPFMGTMTDLLEEAGITQELYEQALKNKSKKVSITMKREPQDVNVNNYNPVLLRALKSNMDIQFITDIWACIAYLCSYMCKPEKTMSELMRKACKEAASQSIRDQLFSIGHVFLKCREVSEHEAVARLLSLPLRRSDLEVVYIGVDYPEDRTRLLKPISEISTMDDDDEDLYLPSIHVKYAARPTSLDNLSLAEFGTMYTTCTKKGNSGEEAQEVDSNESSSTINLQQGLGKMRKRRRPAVMRYHFVSKDKDPEQYYHRLLLLYLPWRCEEELKHEDGTYESKFVAFKDQLVPIIKKYEPYCDQVEAILEDFDPDEAGEDIWDELAAEREKELEDSNDQPDSRFAATDPEILGDVHPHRESRKAYGVEPSLSIVPDTEYYALVTSLNKQQKSLFQFVFEWAVEMRIGLVTPEPFYVFLSGEGGTGKTHLIQAIYQCVVRVLRKAGDDPEKPQALLTAPTGKAATNISGATLHSTFPLPIRDTRSKNTYKKPGAERLSRLRNLFSLLKLVIIDEISMVGGTTLDDISLSLQDITEETAPFGNRSILAVGDLLQLNPVGDRAVFKAPKDDYGALYGSLWQRLFRLHELNEVLRQKGDPLYRDILSRIRIGTFTEDDIHCLKELQNFNSPPEDAIRIFITNQKAHDYNRSMIEKFPNAVTVQARDSSKDLITQSDVVVSSDNIHETGNLPSHLTIADNVRFMLTRNVDTSDMLVNGAMGTVVKHDFPKSNPLSGVLFVKFDQELAGRKARRACPPALKHAVPVKSITVRFLISKKKTVAVERTQYPGVLAWAVTVHKSQGSTYTSMVGDLTAHKNTPISQGLVYTMLSRVTSRKGLFLVGFQPEKIKVNKAALQEMERMRKESLFTWSPILSTIPTDCILIAHLNVRSLRAHYEHLLSEDFLSRMSILCLTETHLTDEDLPERYKKLQSHRIVHKPTAHGLAMLIMKEHTHREIHISTTLEVLACQVDNLLVITVYRPPGPIRNFLSSLEEVLEHLNVNNCAAVLTGDFNMDIHHVLDNLLSKYKLVQIDGSHCPTHIQGGELDLMFTNVKPLLPTKPRPVFFTDHMLLWVALHNDDMELVINSA